MWCLYPSKKQLATAFNMYNNYISMYNNHRAKIVVVPIILKRQFAPAFNMYNDYRLNF